LDAESRSILPLDVLRAFVDAGGAIVALGRDGEPDVPTEMPSELLSGFVRHPVGVRQLLVAVRAGFREAAARAETVRARAEAASRGREIDRKSTRLNSSHVSISYAVFCLKKKKQVEHKRWMQ